MFHRQVARDLSRHLASVTGRSMSHQPEPSRLGQQHQRLQQPGKGRQHTASSAAADAATPSLPGEGGGHVIYGGGVTPAGLGGGPAAAMGQQLQHPSPNLLHEPAIGGTADSILHQFSLDQAAKGALQ